VWGGRFRPTPLVSFSNTIEIETRMRIRPPLILCIALAAMVPVWSVGTAGAAPSVVRAPTTEPAPNDVIVSDEQSDPAPIDPTSGEVVHSWALAPAGSNDTDGANNRPNLSYDGQPGEVIQDAVTLFNLGNEQLTFDVYSTDAFNNASGAFDLLAGDAVPLDIGTWVTFAQDVVTVAPDRAVTIPITITIPQDATPGDHTGGILAASAALSSGEGGGSVLLDRRTGTRLFIRVAGPIRAELAVENLSSKYAGSPNPLGGSSEVTYRIQNRGNIRLSGTHFVKVEGPFGLGTSTSTPVEFPLLLPGQGVDVTAQIDRIPALMLAYTKVEMSPTGPDGELATTSSQRQRNFAPPVTVLLVLLALALALLVRRNVRKRRGVSVEPSLPGRREIDRERQLT
jgi:Bacterial protein of unknown function (DUF916)